MAAVSNNIKSTYPAAVFGVFFLLFSALFVYGVYEGFVYFSTLMLFFYAPATVLLYYVWTRTDRWYRSSIVFINCIALALGIVLEFVAVHLNFWTFYTDMDPLIGLNVGDIPVEEFLFYFGANLQLTTLYASVRHRSEKLGVTSRLFWSWFRKKQNENIVPFDEELRKTAVVVLGGLALILGVFFFRRYFQNHAFKAVASRNGRGRPVYVEGKWYPGWLIAIAPFATAGILWIKRTIRLIHVPAFVISFSINMSLYLLFEYNAIMRGHWVYNQQRLIGWHLADTIPFEQICLYVISFLFLVPFFESVRSALRQISDKKKSETTRNPAQKSDISISRCRKLLVESIEM